MLSVPVCEVEMELIKGNLGDLLSLARQVTTDLNLTLALQSKAERGFALSVGKLDAPVYAEAIELAETSTTSEALCTLIRHSLVHLLGNWSAVTVARDAEGVHQMRVALRRLRSALSLFDDPFRSSLADIESEVRWIADVLGGARDLDVFHAEIFKPVAEAHGSDDRLQELASVVHARRRSAWQDVMDALESERFRKLTLDLAESIHTRPWIRPEDQSGVAEMPAQDFCRVKLGHKWRQAMKMGERIGELDVEERHALRIRLKKLRYGIDLFGSLFSKRRVRQFLKRLGRLQDVLGEMNDAAVARSLVVQLVDDQRGTSRELPVAYAGGLIVGWHVARSRGRHRILRRQWLRFSRLKPFWRTPATIARSPGAG
jgi:CHAD domain-containing protein